MALAVLHCRASVGIEALPVLVEVDLANGLPAFSIVGLPEASVREARERVRSALLNSGFEFPAKRITVNLAPADLPKEGGRFDLAIALGILQASGQLPDVDLSRYEFSAELALSGELRPIQAVIPLVMAAAHSGRIAVVPTADQAEAARIHEAESYCAGHLLEVTADLLGQARLPACQLPERVPTLLAQPDMADVIGQDHAKRALLLAAAGGHNLLMFGPPGSGKTLLASRLPGLLPPLSEQEALEVASIWSVSQQGFATENWGQRPFRAPHHSSSAIALVGGGSVPRPGEISLAHHGVLFLDELPEFERRILDMLRQPLESGHIVISRAARQTTFPAQFQLIAAMNPSPCGNWGNPHQPCRSSPEQIRRYLNRLSGPFLDRFDLTLEVPALEGRMLQQRSATGPTSAELRQQVAAARQQQWQRQQCLNAQLPPSALQQASWLAAEEQQFLAALTEKMGLSARAYHRLIKVARTIADIEQAAHVTRQHLAEAVSYRAMDKLMAKLAT